MLFGTNDLLLLHLGFSEHVDPFRLPWSHKMKPARVLIAKIVVSLFLAPTVLAQSPDSANQSAASSGASAAEVPRLIKFSGTLLDCPGPPHGGSPRRGLFSSCAAERRGARGGGGPATHPPGPPPLHRPPGGRPPQ